MNEVEKSTSISNHNRLAYMPELDGLRGVAIIGVMLAHAKVPFLKGGSIGVSIFFVLSGFLITTLLVQEFDRFQSISLKNFYMRRVIRLAPALIAMLIVFCLLSFVLLSKDRAYWNYTDSIIAVFYFSNWAKAFSIHPPDFLLHTWSLSVEEQFYMIWPIVLLLILRVSKHRYYAAIVAVTIALLSCFFRIFLCASGATIARLYFGLDTRIDGLMVGCTLGVVISSGLIADNLKTTLSKITVIIAPFSAVALFVFFVLYRHQDPATYYFGFIVVQILAAILIIDIFLNSQSSFIGKRLSNQWLV